MLRSRCRLRTALSFYCHFDMELRSACNLDAVPNNLANTANRMMRIERRLLLFLYLTPVIVASLRVVAQEPVGPATGPSLQLPSVPGQVVTLTTEAGFHNEPSIAVNLNNSSQLVAA